MAPPSAALFAARGILCLKRLWFKLISILIVLVRLNSNFS